MDINNKIALVTGASRGIGQAIARTLAERGAYVIGTATTVAGAEMINAMFANHSLRGEGVVLDVTQPDNIDSLMALLAEQQKNPEILNQINKFNMIYSTD